LHHPVPDHCVTAKRRRVSRWFYRIVVREASELKRRRARAEHATEPAPNIADQTASMDVWRALLALPQNLRDVIVLRYFEDLSSREIASVLRIPAGTVRFRLMIAKRRLHPLLSDSPEPTGQVPELV